jgi:non-ribosomal peptide synthetase component F
MGLLAAFRALLCRLSGREGVSLGSPITGRTRAETEGLIGFFVNTLVSATSPTIPRSTISSNAWCAPTGPTRTRAALTSIGGLPRADLGARVPGSLQRVQLPQDSRMELPGLTVELRHATVHVRFDLTLYVVPQRRTFSLSSSTTRTYSARATWQLLEQYDLLLQQVVSGQGPPLNHSLITTRARLRLPDPGWSCRSLYELVTTTVLSGQNGRPGVAVCPGTAWTYHELRQVPSSCSAIIGSAAVEGGGCRRLELDSSRVCSRCS